jgi:hypothetical protein
MSSLKVSEFVLLENFFYDMAGTMLNIFGAGASWTA